MTKESWQKHKSRGLTEIDTPTCLPAALDTISSRTSVSEDTYWAYIDAYQEQSKNGYSSRRVRDLYRKLLEDLTGSNCLKSISYRRANSLVETHQVLNKAKQGGKRVFLAVKDGHLIGVRPVSNGWKVSGNTWLDTENIFTVEEINGMLWKGRREFKGKTEANIFLFPSEPKKPKR